MHRGSLPLAAGITVGGNATGKLGVVGQQRLVDDGYVYALAGNAPRLQAAYTQAGVFTCFQQCGSLVLGPGKHSAGVIGVGVQVGKAVFARLVGLLGAAIQPGQITQIAVGRGRGGCGRTFLGRRCGHRCGGRHSGIHRRSSPAGCQHQRQQAGGEKYGMFHRKPPVVYNCAAAHQYTTIVFLTCCKKPGRLQFLGQTGLYDAN